MRVVHVEWIDSQTEYGWEKYEKENYGLADLSHSVGMLIDETEHYAVIAHSYDPSTDEWNGKIAIPLAAINEMRTLCQIKMPKPK